MALVLGAGSGAPALAQDAAVIDKTLDLEFWRSVATSTDPALFDAYLQQFPNGTFAALARVKAATLRRAAPIPATPSAAPPPVVPAPAPPILPAVVTAAASPAPAMPPAVASDAAPAASDAADLALLARLAATQETPVVQTPAPTDDLAAERPRLDSVPSITLPARFCSAEERNAFHAQIFRPASAVAEANNTRAIGYLHAIQTRYDAMAMGDPDKRNALAREGLAYKPIADATFQAQQALVRQFDALMAVPISACAPAR